MKKFLLLICLSLFSLVSFAQVDTLCFKPGDELNYALTVDTVKYPYLEQDDVTWFYGYDDVSFPIPVESIITVKGVKYFHSEELGNNWGIDNLRTITIFNSHTITPTKASGTINDTTAVLHILKDFTKVTNPTDVISSFQVNAVGITLGDTVKLTATPVEPLDIEQYALVANEEAIAVSDTGYFELVPNESIDGIQLVVTNATGELILPWAKSVVVYPPFMISELYSSVTSGEVTTINRVEGTNTTELNIFNHDSVRLKVSTNIKETIQPDAGVRYAWNKDGQNLPEGINVVNKNSLDIPEYDKETMDGTYNCIVTSGDNTITVSYKITSQWPTANEDITADAVKVFVKDSNIWVDNVTNKQVRIVNAIGQVVYTKMITSTGMSVNVPSGIYFVVVDDTTYKVIVK